MVSLCLAIYLLLSIAHVNAQSDFLSDYFTGKVFGADPGPCPNSANKCRGNLDTDKLPQSVKDIQLTLFEGYCFGIDLGFLGCAGYDGGFTRPLGGPNGWLQSGIIDIWNLRCENMGINGLTLQLNGGRGFEKIFTDISASNFRQKCDGKTEFDDLTVEYSNAPVVGDIRIVLSGTSDFRTNSGTSGLDFALTIEWYASYPGGNGITFLDQLPDFVEIPEERCTIATNQRVGFQLFNQNYDDVTASIFGITFSVLGIFTFFELDNLFVSALEATFGVTLCGLFEDAAVTDQGQQGALNDYLQELRTEFYNDIAAGEPFDVQFLDSNLVALTNNGAQYPVSFAQKQFGFPVSQSQLDLSINFNDSSIFEILSVGVNEWLNEPADTRAGLEYNKTINEVIERITGTEVNGVVEPNVFGTAYLDLVEDGYFLNTSIDLDWARLLVALERIDFQGLNTVTDFGLIENNYCEDELPDCDASQRLNYTLNHTLGAGNVKIGLKIRMTLFSDDWVTQSQQCGSNPSQQNPPCTADSTEYVFYANLTFEDWRLEASTVQAFNLDLLDELQIGQLTGIDFGGQITAAVDQAVKCIGPGFYTLNVPNLNFSVTDLTEPEADFEDDNNGLAQLVSTTVQTFNVLAASTLTTELPEFVQGDNVRGNINAYLWDEIDFKNLDNCAPYVIPPTNEALNFEFGIVSYLYPVINRVLGGAHITTRDTDTDINDLIQIGMEYYSDSFDEFIFQPVLDGNDIPVQGDFVTKDEFETFGVFQAYEDFGLVENNYFNFGGVKIFNLNQVEEMIVGTFGETEMVFK